MIKKYINKLLKFININKRFLFCFLLLFFDLIYIQYSCIYFIFPTYYCSFATISINDTSIDYGIWSNNLVSQKVIDRTAALIKKDGFLICGSTPDSKYIAKTITVEKAPVKSNKFVIMAYSNDSANINNYVNYYARSFIEMYGETLNNDVLIFTWNPEDTYCVNDKSKTISYFYAALSSFSFSLVASIVYYHFYKKNNVINK